jgi:poly [ADP-ribose] polymerase 10/14/15
MERITETSSEIIKLNTDVLNHAIKNCEQEIRDRFGADILEVFSEKKEELIVSSELAKNVKEYMEQFTVKEIPFCKKLLDTSREKLKLMLTAVKKENITIEMQEEQPQIQLVGKKKCVNELYWQLKDDILELEKGLDVVTEQLVIPGYKLELFLLHGVDEMFKNEFHVDVKIEQKKQTITIKGPENNVSLATKEAYKKFNLIMEDNVDFNDAEKHFIGSGGLEILNNGMKTIGMKGMVSLLRESETSKAKVLAFDDATIKDVRAYLRSNVFLKQYLLDEDSLALLNSNKWKEFLENVTKNTSVMIYVSGRNSNEIALIGQNSEVEETYETLQQFMKRNTIIKESVDLNEGYVGYLTKYCAKDLEEIGKNLEEHSVRMQLMEQEGTVNIHGTKEGVKEAKKQMNGIMSNIATGKICFDKLRNKKYLESDEGKLSMSGIETSHKCSVRLIEDDGERSTIIPTSRPNQPSKLLCSYETQEKVSLKVFKDDITAHGCDVVVNAANGDLNHIGGVAKSILDVGGNEIQEECDAFVKREGQLFDGECFSGSPGKLPCKRLIHAVGPRWDNSYPGKTCTTLRVTCMRALEEAKDYRSIAIPAIGSGIYGIPKDICADIMIEAAEKFGKEYDNCALKEIRFVNIDDTTSQVFLKKFREKFGGRSSFKDNQGKNTGRRFGSPVSRSHVKESKREEKNVTAEVLPRRKPGDFITTKGGMKISVAVGDLSTYKVMCIKNRCF